MQGSPSQDYMMKSGMTNKLKDAKSPDRGGQQDKGKTITWLRDKLKSTLENTCKEPKTISKTHSKGKYDLRHSAEQLDSCAGDWKFSRLATPFVEDPVGGGKSNEKGDSSTQHTLHAFLNRSTKLFGQNALKQVAVELISGMLLSFLTEPSLIGLDNTITLLKKILDIGGLYSGFDLRRKSSSSAKTIFQEKCLGKKVFEQSVTNFVENLLFGRITSTNKGLSSGATPGSLEGNNYSTESQRRAKKLMIEVLQEDSFTSGTGSTDMRSQFNQESSSQIIGANSEIGQTPRKGLRHIQMKIQRPEIDQSVAYLEFIKCIIERMGLPVSLWRVMMIDKARMLSSQEKVYEPANQLLFSSRLQILVTIDGSTSLYFRFGIPQTKERLMQTAKATVSKYITLSKKYQGSVERKPTQEMQAKYMRSDQKVFKADPGLKPSEPQPEEHTQRSNNLMARSQSSRNHSARGREGSVTRDKNARILNKKTNIVEINERGTKKIVVKEIERVTYPAKEHNSKKPRRDLYSQLLVSKNTKGVVPVIDRISEVFQREAENAPSSARGVNAKKHYVLDTGNTVDHREPKVAEESRLSDKANPTKTLDSFLEKYMKKKNIQTSKFTKKMKISQENRHSFDYPKTNPNLKKLAAEKTNLTIDPFFEAELSIPNTTGQLQVESMRVSPKPFYDRLSFNDHIKESTRQAIDRYYACEDVKYANVMVERSVEEDGKRDSESRSGENVAVIQHAAQYSVQHWAVKQKITLGIGGFIQLLAEHTSRIVHSLKEPEVQGETPPALIDGPQVTDQMPSVHNKQYLHRNSSSISKSQSDLYKPLSSKKSMKSITEITRELHGSIVNKELTKNFCSFTYGSSTNKQFTSGWVTNELRQTDSAKNLRTPEHATYPVIHSSSLIGTFSVPSHPQQIFSPAQLLKK